MFPLLFFSLRSSPDAGPGRLKCEYQAVFAKSLDGRFLVLIECVLSSWYCAGYLRLLLGFPLTLATSGRKLLLWR